MLQTCFALFIEFFVACLEKKKKGSAGSSRAPSRKCFRNTSWTEYFVFCSESPDDLLDLESPLECNRLEA